MVVFVCEDILKVLDDPLDINHEHARRVFNEVSIASLRGKHFVLIENFLNKKIEEIVRKNTSDKNFECFKKCNSTQTLSILNLVDVVLIISFHTINGNVLKHRYNNHKLLTLNPAKNTEIEIFEETHLITEGQNDGKLFEAITRRYMKGMDLPKLLELSILNRGAGGYTISEKYDQEKRLGAHLCITIVDSDKKYPKGKEGATATELRTHIDERWKYSDTHIMSELSEIENLLPVLQYRNKSNKPLINWLSNYDLSFFDLKCGLTAETLKNEDCYAHWSIMGIGLPSMADIQAKANNTQIIKGVGNQAMASFLKRKNYMSDVIGIKDKDLSQNQKREYSAISTLIFNWCVCSVPAKL